MLRISEVCKTFNPGTNNEVRALTNVSLEVAKGSFLIIIGMNGSGKSTVLNAVAGSFELDSGSLHLAGQAITRWPEHRRARLIGRVFQNPFSGTAPSMSIAENLALATRRGKGRGLGPALSPRVRQELRDRVRVLNMGLEDRLDNPIGTLSGGQRQALTLLMATWLKPDLLLLDEHTAALDPKSADQVIELTHEIVTRDNLTTLMVTHSMQQAANLGDRIVMMHKGRVLHDLHGRSRESVKAEDLLQHFEDLRRREQLGETASTFLRSAKGATELLAVFEAIAAVDEQIDAREIAIIEDFANYWNLPSPGLTAGPVQSPGDILEIRKCVANYLKISPPVAQATELLDVLHNLVNADESISEEEEIVMDEVTAMIMGYVTHSSDRGAYEVVIVPQTDEQRTAVKSLLAGVEAKPMRGGIVYSVGRFYSAKYADVVCDKYVALGLFTTRIDVPH
jgi:putative ABC transport system ATP-binding protein